MGIQYQTIIVKVRNHTGLKPEEMIVRLENHTELKPEERILKPKPYRARIRKKRSNTRRKKAYNKQTIKFQRNDSRYRLNNCFLSLLSEGRDFR